jgi:formylglycine-generating enzyme required for sulfatase activity
LSEQTGQAYRLPTEAEWEYAARGGTTAPFSTGGCIHADQANYDGHYDYNGCGAKTGVRLRKTVPVGSYPANPFGLYDMAGNVWEWTCSAYTGGGYDGSEKTCTNDASARRATRGGSWNHGPRDVRSANRNWVDPARRDDTLGFRLAQD